MSIVIKDKHGWFICSKTYVDKISEYCFDKDEKKRKTMKLRREYFDIKTPFLMKSAAIKKSNSVKNEILEKEQSNQKKKKRKKKISVSLTPLEVTIKERSDFLCKKAQELSFLENSPITGDEWFQNNSVAINAAKAIPRCIQESYSFSNSNETPVLKVFGNEKFLIPSLSTFHLCDISSLDSLKGEKFNLILMDPPWENKGVKRKKGYNTLHHTLLDSLPIEELCLHGSLIAVWVTNNSTQINYVKEVLFPKWKIQKSTIWHWTKVTQKGNYVHPFGWHHKKPYENLLLGFHNTEQITHCMQEFTDHKVIVSIPSSVHSQKPPLAEILEPYLPENPKCLELFARYLIPSWTSVGNEVLKLQNIKLFEVPDS